MDPAFLGKLRLADAVKWSHSLAHMQCGAQGCGQDYILAISNHLNGRLRADTFLAASASDGWAILSVGRNRGVVLCPRCLKELYLELTATLEDPAVDEVNFQSATERFSVVLRAISVMQGRWGRVEVENRTADLRD